MNLFRFLTDEQLEFVNQSRYEVRFLKGEIIFKQGGPLTHIACLTSGKAKVYIEGSDHKNMILKILKPTELVGGPGFRVDYRHHFSISALEDSTACFIEVEVFEKMLQENTNFCMEFIGYLNNVFIRQYAKLISLTQKNMYGRIADTLLYLSKEIHKSNSFNISLSRQDIADLSAMTKESAIRILTEFKKDGIIDYSSVHFKISDDKALMNISKTG